MSIPLISRSTYHFINPFKAGALAKEIVEFFEFHFYFVRAKR